MDAFKDYTGTFELSFKYSIAHMYSIPNPPFIKEALPSITADHRTWLTVRDDDIYSFRWGNPEFAREFIRNMPGPDKVAGFYMGGRVLNLCEFRPHFVWSWQRITGDATEGIVVFRRRWHRGHDNP